MDGGPAMSVARRLPAEIPSRLEDWRGFRLPAPAAWEVTAKTKKRRGLSVEA